MFLLPKGTGPPAAAGPTSLLSLVAGEFAPQVAALWPAPHIAFVTAPAARRHLVCLALTLGRSDACRAALDERLPRAIAAAVGEGPPGLARALTRIGDLAWATDDYRTLLRLLADPKAGKALRHAEALDPGVLRRMETLPTPMAGAIHLALALNADGAAVLREAYEALRFRDGDAAADAAATRWADAESAKAVFAAARDDLAPEIVPPPFAGTGRLRPIASKSGLLDAARRYRNCLADHLPHAATGWSAYYEWLVAPGAIVQISRDHVFGWRLDEVRAPRNAAVSKSTREAITDELALIGVHVGRNGWELHRALAADVGVAYRLRPPHAAADEAFVV